MREKRVQKERVQNEGEAAREKRVQKERVKNEGEAGIEKTGYRMRPADSRGS